MLKDGSNLFLFVLIRGPFAEQARSWTSSWSSLSTELTEDPESCYAVDLDLKQNNNNKKTNKEFVLQNNDDFDFLAVFLKTESGSDCGVFKSFKRAHLWCIYNAKRE